MALSLTILSIIAASFALGVNFADIRAEARERIEARRQDHRRAQPRLGEFRPAAAANTNRPECRPAA